MFISKSKENDLKESHMEDVQNVLADSKNALGDDDLEHVVGGACFYSIYEDDGKEKYRYGK